MPRSEKQKLKLFYIADYLMTETDEEHGVYAKDIKEHLASKGISAEEHSISRDIALLRDEFGMDILGGGGKPFWLCSRFVDYQDLATIAECVASAKFVCDKEAKRLVGILKRFCSRHQQETIRSEAFVSARGRTTERHTIDNLALIRDAIHKDEKIEFNYNYHKISNLAKPFQRRDGAKYSVSPYQIILNDGNFYLLAYDDKAKKALTYRIDRMSGVDYQAGVPREGEKAFKRVDFQNYTTRSFGMFGGSDDEIKRITIRFQDRMLDTVLDRFGKGRSSIYKPADKGHFTITTSIIPSPLFYAWLCGFGTSAVIVDPPEVVQEFRDFLKKIQHKYED